MSVEDMKPGERMISDCRHCGRVIIIEKPEGGLTVCHEEPPCEAFRSVMAQAMKEQGATETTAVYDTETGHIHRLSGGPPS